MKIPFFGAEGSHIDPEKITAGPSWTVTGPPLFEDMPQHDEQPSDGDESARNNYQIELAHPFLIQMRPTELSVTC